MRLVPVVMLWVAAAAGASGQSLSLRAAVDRAVRQHPMLAAQDQEIAAAQGLRVQAGLRPNPTLNLQSENTRFYGTPTFRYGQNAETFAFLQQTFLTAGKRDRRVEFAETEVRMAQLERELAARQIGFRVKAAYWQAVGAQKQRELLLDTLETYARILQYHEVRVREGATAEADLIRVRLEFERLEIAASDAELEAERARIGLYREMGQKQYPRETLSEPLEQGALELPAYNVEAALENRTEMKIARQARQQSVAGIGLQRSLARPDVSGLFGYKRTEGFNTLIAGLQMDMPLRDRNQGNVAAAEARLRVADATLAATEAIVQAEAGIALRQVELRRRQLGQTIGSLRANARESSEIALAAYRHGGWELLRLLDAQRQRIEVEQMYYRLLTEYQVSRVTLEAALGMEP
jgi:outer membrane protein, heavy metal efflux system